MHDSGHVILPLHDQISLSSYLCDLTEKDDLLGAPGWLSGLAPAFGPGHDSWSPRIESRVGLPAWSLLLPLPVSLPLSFSVSLMNK